MCFPNILVGVGVRMLTDVAKALCLKRKEVQCLSIEHAYNNCEFEEAAINSYVRYACIVGEHFAHCEGLDKLSTSTAVIAMVREVFENMTTTSHTPVKFLYDGVFDMLSIMLDDMPTDPKDAEEIRMLACGCDIVYDEFHLSDKDQEDGDED